MITELRLTVGVSVIHDADVAGADETSARFQKRRAAAVREFFSIAVEIRAGDFPRATHTHFVSAVRALAALPPVDKEIIKIVVPRQARRLDGMIPRELIQRRVRAEALAGLRIEFRQKNSLPIRAERQSQLSVHIQKCARLNRVER